VTEIAHIRDRAAERENGTAARERLAHARPDRALLLAPVGILTLCAIVLGFATRGEQDFVPDEGLGYALGIIGLAMMTLLLLYSLRKRWRPLRRAGRIQLWFQIHMALGLLGPMAILFHGNFEIPGSLNARVALVCMFVVSLSGVVGRFIYTRVHYEFLGHVATLEELRADAQGEGHVLREVVQLEPQVDGILQEFRDTCLQQRSTWAGHFTCMLTMGWRERASRRRVRRAWDRAAERPAEPTKKAVHRAAREQLRAIRRVGEYATYERLFALWHTFHLPFCIGLFVAATVHVVAVHMY
jgi:hypothetical protein